MDTTTSLDDLEEGQLPRLFGQKGQCFLGGRTAGYYGPYIWTTTETVTYGVELPGGYQDYTVNLLDGFCSQSWLDYLSLVKLVPADGQTAMA